MSEGCDDAFRRLGSQKDHGNTTSMSKAARYFVEEGEVPRFAANLSTMFAEHDFLDRFQAAKNAGFGAVEFQFPYDFAAADIASRLTGNDLSLELFNLPPGNFGEGERGIAAIPGREAEFERGVAVAFDYAAVLGCHRLHCMAGLLPGNVDVGSCENAYIRNLTYVAELAAEKGITVLIEPINTRDIPGYFLNFQNDARRIIETIGADNLKLQLDLYHCQIMEGDLAMHIKELLAITGHIQIAGVPERHEPDVGEINYPHLYQLLDDLGYDGWIGCEYLPKGRTEDGLSWFAPYRSN